MASTSRHRPSVFSSSSIPLFLVALLPTTAQAYTWAFQATPQQCSNLTIAISGNDGKPPYRVLILPSGPTPLPNNIEARRIIDMPFPGNQNQVSFQLKYPENSQFVAVVSDASGFGSGGTSVAAQVTASNDASCFDAKTMVSPDFVFSVEPPNQIVQCQDTRLWWDPATVQGTPNFLGIIPGGQSFAVPQSSITTVQSQGTGFTWKPPIRGGTTLIIVGGDNRGNGTAGSVLNVVSSGINNDGSCLSSGSPSSTPGSPAGGSYPTGKDGGSTGGGSSSGGSSNSNIGAIVGGVLGGLAFLIALLLLFWFYRRRSKKQKREKERPVDLLNDDDDGDDVQAGHRRNELPQYYQPEPFLVPDPTLPRSSMEGSTHTGTNTNTGLLSGSDDYEGRRPHSGATTTSFYTRTTSPDPLSGASSSAAGGRRKGGAPRPMRPVNIIQHDDAGPSVPPEEEDDADKDRDEPETIELPPAYTAVKKPGAAATTPPPTEVV